MTTCKPIRRANVEVWHAHPTDADDMIYHQEGGTRAVLRIRKRAGGGYLGSLTMGVRRA